MCLPVLGLVGGVISGIGAAMGASQTAASYEAQAAFHRRQAQMERDKGAYEAGRQQDKAQVLMGEQIANYGASGVEISGSPAAVIMDSAQEADLDVGAIRYGSKIRSSNESYEARMAHVNASNARASIPFAFISPVISGATSLVRAF